MKRRSGVWGFIGGGEMQNEKWKAVVSRQFNLPAAIHGTSPRPPKRGFMNFIRRRLCLPFFGCRRRRDECRRE